ncbi:MAG: helix-turn-helix transcriptional regulator [Fibrobacteria bacterium]
MFSFSKSSDPISLFDALYDLDTSREGWCNQVLSSAGTFFDQGLGVGLVRYDVSGNAPCIECMQGYNVSEKNMRSGLNSHLKPEWAQVIVNSYRTMVCATMDEYVPDLEMRAALRKFYQPVGIRDAIMVNGVGPSRVGCALVILSAEMFRIAPRERQMLTRIATHLSTAYRLHRRLERVVEAVLTPSGKIEHAESTASSNSSLSSLTGAVKLREWARTRSGRRDSERSTDAWKPLVAGRWSLVDSYERGGRRYITACENAPAPAGIESLSPRERQVSALAELGRSNKVIAYELGLGHSTVRVLLARAASKLGVGTRGDLVNRIRSLLTAAG